MSNGVSCARGLSCCYQPFVVSADKESQCKPGNDQQKIDPCETRGAECEIARANEDRCCRQHIAAPLAEGVNDLFGLVF